MNPATRDTRASLLDAASEIIEQRHQELPGVAELARAAGVSRPTVYAHFRSGDDLVAALADRVRKEVLALQENAETSSITAVYRSTLVGNLAIQVRHVGLLALLADQARRDQRMARLWHDIHDRPLRRHARYIDRLAAAGLARPALPAWLIAEAVHGATARFAQIIAEGAATFPELAEHLVQLQSSLLGLLDTGEHG